MPEIVSLNVKTNELRKGDTVVRSITAENVVSGKTRFGGEFIGQKVGNSNTTIELSTGKIIVHYEAYLEVIREQLTAEETAALELERKRDYTMRRIQGAYSNLIGRRAAIAEQLERDPMYSIADEIARRLEELTEAEANWEFAVRVLRMTGEDGRTIEEAHELALKQTMQQVLRGADDTWSGRFRNDVRRVTHAAQCKIVEHDGLGWF